MRGAKQLDNDIKLIYAVATNCLINQHADINRTADILRDETKVEFIVVQDNFLTSSARFADIVLPACTQFETWGVEDGWKYGDEVILQPKLVEPPGECKSDYRICAELAERLGIGDAFTEGRDELAWTEYCLGEFRRIRFPNCLPSKSLSSRTWVPGPVQPPGLPLPLRISAVTRRISRYRPPSGKIEIFSKQLFDLDNPAEIPAVPKYIQEWESPFDNQLPPQTLIPFKRLVTTPLHRVHSTHDNNDWLNRLSRSGCLSTRWMPLRGISDGDPVKVYNRGALVLPLPHHCPHPARRSGHPPGRLVAAGRGWAGYRWQYQCAHIFKMDALRIWSARRISHHG